jgi:hypothetical protein
VETKPLEIAREGQVRRFNLNTLRQDLFCTQN